MATTDTPGYNPKNNDKLAVGAWAEHDDGSMVYVKGITENDIVVFDLYDFQDPKRPIFYPHALAQTDFEKQFSYNGTNIKWTWHDKTEMDWSRVMRNIKSPVPVSANVEDTLSAAAQMAQSLKIRLSETLNSEHVERAQGFETRTTSRTIFDRLKNAMHGFVS